MHANQEVMRLKIAPVGDHLTENSKICLLEDELDQSKVQIFTKKIVTSSYIHSSVEFKDLTSQMANSVIGRSVKIGSNVKIQNCVVMNNVEI
jgi:UDP-3-O-[3-hydroxymyristoyl] glucosamine N-acyltransferase